MFELKNKHGDHTVFGFDCNRHKFLEYFEELYGVDINNIASVAKDFHLYREGCLSDLTDVETDLHKKFYTAIKSSEKFKSMYCMFINDIYKNMYPNVPYLVYQSFPSVRFQFIDHVTVPPHCDSDDIGRHPLGEINFLVPLTSMRRSNRLFIESTPQKGDFQGIDLDYGDLLKFNGNKCIHYNEKNNETWVRISLDFRVLLPDDYARYISQKEITITNPRDPEKTRAPLKMIIGGYYQCMFNTWPLDRTMQWHHVKGEIVQSRPVFGYEESSACATYFNDGDPFVTEFKKTVELEKMFKELTGAAHCIMTTSGTTALMMAYQACGLQPGDEIIIPNFTMVATANAALALGAIPVLVDVNPESYTIDLNSIRNALTDKTKIVVHVSLNNRSNGLESIAEFCRAKKIFLIEDAAQSVGCKLNGRHFGTFGDIGCFSLSTPKIISTGQGGVLCTSNDAIAAKLAQLKNFGRKLGAIEVYDSFGLNNKFTDIQAVIGIEQMKKLPMRILRMRALWNVYYSRLQDIMLPPPSDDWIPWFVEIFSPDRDGLMAFLKEHHVMTRPCYPSLHTTAPYSSDWGTVCFTHSSRMSDQGLFMPTHMMLSDNDINFICTLVEAFHKTIASTASTTP